MSLALFESFGELLCCIILGQVPADKALYTSDVLIFGLRNIDIRKFLTEVTKDLTSAALVEPNSGSRVEIKLSFVLSIDHLHESVGSIVALKEIVTVYGCDRREVELCIKKIVKAGDLKVLGCLVAVCLSLVAITESHKVVRADNGIGEMKSELLKVPVRELSVALEETVEPDTLRLGLDPVCLESITESSVTKLVLLVVHRAADKV